MDFGGGTGGGGVGGRSGGGGGGGRTTPPVEELLGERPMMPRPPPLLRRFLCSTGVWPAAAIRVSRWCWAMSAHRESVLLVASPPRTVLCPAVVEVLQAPLED
jgi:hypothetical protein